MVLSLPDGQRRLSRRVARALRDELTEALAGRREFLHTAGAHREDGRYVVTRRNADSAGHAKRFESFRALERLYEALPREFDAAAVGRTARAEDRPGAALELSGNRRHLVLRHLAEHPAFDCELVSRQPLTARKAERSPAAEATPRERARFG